MDVRGIDRLRGENQEIELERYERSIITDLVKLSLEKIRP